MRSQTVKHENEVDKQEYIKKFCGLNNHKNCFPKDAKCDIIMGPLEERCETCGLITQTGWLAEHLEKQDKQIKVLDRDVSELSKLLLRAWQAINTIAERVASDEPDNPRTEIEDS